MNDLKYLGVKNFSTIMLENQEQLRRRREVRRYYCFTTRKRHLFTDTNPYPRPPPPSAHPRLHRSSPFQGPGSTDIGLSNSKFDYVV